MNQLIKSRMNKKKKENRNQNLKSFPYGLLVTALFAAMLLFPKAVFNGATEGLLLWYQVVFPTLFPFMVITGLLLSTGGLHLITRVIGGPFRRMFRVSENGAFAVLAGFLCGYPMGAKVTADLIRSGRISLQEGRYLLSFCNNTSPVFILNFLVWKTFGEEKLSLPSLAILTAAPVLISLFTRRYYLQGAPCFRDTSPASQAGSGEHFNFQTFDSSMMNSFEGIVKVGGYIILFSVLIALLDELPGESPLLLAAAPTLEVTNGILLIRQNISCTAAAWCAALGLTAFGGFCSAAQTQCMIQGTGLSIFPYIIQKLAAAGAASLLALLYIMIFF